MENKNNFIETWGIPFLVSLGLGTFVRLIFYYSSKKVDVSFSYGDCFNLEFLVTVIASATVIIPLKYLYDKNLKIAIGINKVEGIIDNVKSEVCNVGENISRIESTIHTDIDKNLNDIDFYYFNENIHTNILERIKKIHSNNYSTSILKSALNQLINDWKRIGTNHNTDLHQLIYHYFVRDLRKNENNDSSSYLMSISSYLDFLLDIISIGFKDDRKFYYYSYTNALPSSWFSIENSNSPLRRYREEFAKILSEYNNENNITRRYILGYKDLDNDIIIKNNIYSSEKILEDWNNLSGERKDVYKTKFVKANNAFTIGLNKNFNFNKGFTELIYFGGDKNGSPDWKWVIVGEYIPNTKSMLFELVCLRELNNEPYNIAEIKVESNFEIVQDGDTISGASNSIKIDINDIPKLFEEEIKYKIKKQGESEETLIIQKNILT